MVKLIIQVSDIHIRNFRRMEEYAEQLTKFVEKCRDITTTYNKDEVRIVICGDLIHNKNQVTPELYSFTSTFLRQLSEIATVILIAGNHDLVVNNSSRKDAISSLFETAQFENVKFLDMMLEYESGYVVDDNITWCVYSIYNDFMKPDILKARYEYPDNKTIGLYHGMIVGSTLNNGTVVDMGVDGNIFEGCECVMAGDIHKRQELKRGDVPIVYSGSLIQQTFGETVTQHGFSLWNMETMEHKFIDLESEYNLYDIEISSFEDIDNDKEILKNF